MKKMLAVCLAALLLFSACSGSPASSISTFREFEQKYQFEDFDAVLEDPAQFLADLAQLEAVKDGSPLVVLDVSDGWTDDSITQTMDKAGSIGSYFYNKDITLLWRPAAFSVFQPPAEDGRPFARAVILELDAEDYMDDFRFARSMALYLMDRPAGEVSAELNDAECDVETLRKFLKNEKDAEQYFEGLDEFGFDYNSDAGHATYHAYRWRTSEAPSSYASVSCRGSR